MSKHNPCKHYYEQLSKVNSFEHICSGNFIEIQLKYDLRLKHSISIGPKLKAKEKDCFQAIKIAI